MTEELSQKTLRLITEKFKYAYAMAAESEQKIRALEARIDETDYLHLLNLHDDRIRELKARFDELGADHLAEWCKMVEVRLDRIDNPGRTHYEGDDCPGGHQASHERKETRRMAIEEAALYVVKASNDFERLIAVSRLRRALEMA